MNKIFFSYSKHDYEMLGQLQCHLALLKNQGLIDTWYDRDIVAGKEWDEEVKQKLKEADIILLLVSSDFLATEYIWKTEVMEAMRRYESREAKVIPIILRPCDWEAAPFGKLNALPVKGKPVSNYADRDEAWLVVVEGIKRVMDTPLTIKKRNVPSSDENFSPAGREGEVNYQIGNIHKLLNAAFNDESLQTFCLLNFEKVYNNFTAGQTKGQRLLALIDYVKRHLEEEKLLSLLQKENPAHFEQFKPYF